MKVCLGVCLLAGWISLGAIAASAQEVVHALVGTFVSTNPSAKTIQINTEDGSEGLFNDMTKSHVALDIDKSLLAGLTPADKLTSKGTHVIVFYFGNLAVRIAVGLRDLGPGPLKTASGSVSKFQKHEHLLTLQTSSGTDKVFHIETKTVAETSVGAVPGYRFDPEKSEQLRIVSLLENGTDTALYIYAK
jgi:hypothetical protein